MNEHAADGLLEAVISPHRQRDPEGRPMPPPEWWDLPPEALDRAYREALQARIIEKGLDARGRSGTVRAVMARITGG